METQKSNLIVVSNRLPVTIKKEEDGTWSGRMSSGGLVAALSGLDKNSFKWIGWVGCEVAPEDQETVTKMLLDKYSCVPVYLDEKVADEHYNGFSNGVLWPLCHYLPGDLDYDEKLWDSYTQANKEFVETVANIYQPGDLIWVHDYHLMLFAKYFKLKVRDAKIGFFLHIPFPSSEIFRVLPCRKEILLGVLNCDLIGFHTYDYARHFLKACTRILGLETTPNGVTFHDKRISVGIFPVGIDPSKFTEKLQTIEVQARVNELTEKFHDKKVLVGVDRLDYIKGIPHKLLAIEELFRKYPEWQGKLVLIQVAVPSRQDVEEYQRLKRDVEELVGRINGTYGTLGYSPIHYLFKSVDMAELSALYSIADAAIISSIRDGMNLVAQEYVVCQQQKKGVLILSEFTGSAGSLSGSILVNPWNMTEMADGIHSALTMNVEERTERLRTLTKYITRHTAAYWGSSFVNELKKTTTMNETVTNTPALNVAEVLQAYRHSKRSLIIVAYDGTLVPYSSLPALCRPPKSLLTCLRKLADQNGNTVYILSGRDRKTMQGWFSNLGVGLSAEYGCFIKAPKEGKEKEKEWDQVIANADMAWKDNIRPLLEYFAARTPGSFVEEKEMHLTFHYRNADPVFGSIQAKELHLHLDNLPVDVVVGHHSLGVRSISVNPTVSMKKVITDMIGEGLDFLLIVGDTHVNPQDLPQLDNGHVFTCAVGKKNSREKYYLHDSSEVSHLLNTLAKEAPSAGAPLQ